MRTGLILIMYCFIIIVLYMVLSSPFDDFMTSFSNINSTASDTHVDNAVGYGRLVFDMMFGILLLGPVIWFIAELLREEPEWGYRE